MLRRKFGVDLDRDEASRSPRRDVVTQVENRSRAKPSSHREAYEPASLRDEDSPVGQKCEVRRLDQAAHHDLLDKAAPKGRAAIGDRRRTISGVSVALETQVTAAVERRQDAAASDCAAENEKRRGCSRH